MGNHDTYGQLDTGKRVIALKIVEYSTVRYSAVEDDQAQTLYRLAVYEITGSFNTVPGFSW